MIGASQIIQSDEVVEGARGAQGVARPLPTTESFHTVRSQETTEHGVRSYWLSIGDMFQRRVIDPMGRLTSGMTTTTTPNQRSSAPLIPRDLQQAMATHQSRNSLISLQHRRQEEKASSSSVNQEMVLEEVKRQVALAMHGRDQEVISLKQRNEELERALAEANSAMCAIGNGGTLSGPTGDQGRLQDPVA